MKSFPHILPLFWLHGEEFPVIEREIRAMHSAGLRGFIIESRPFPDYMGKRWWETLEFIFALAEELGMKALLFDDSHFPSGYADGKIAAEHPEHLRLLLEPVTIDVSHPGGAFSFNPDDHLCVGDREIAKVFLFKRLDGNTFDSGSLVELPRSAFEIELAAGDYVVNLWKITRNGGEKHTHNYINFLSHEAARCYIDTIYAPHVKKLQQFVGRSFIGFFSDEPRLGNAASYGALPGKESMSLPYHPSLDLTGLPHLMMESNDKGITGSIRQRFMEQVSRLYSKAFPQQVGEFCRRHNLIYIGHVIEDNGAHSRLGYGDGHYFRSQEGQDWAGVDTVLGQNRPDCTDGVLPSVFGQYNSRFFHWELMLLAGSCGAINGQPAFVEDFGAYGWGEGLSEMKWHTDLALVRGVNRIVPHAFSPKYPDPDCPPHFFAQGNNPQWPFFHLWREYADIACQMLSEGDWTTRCGVLYHAEAEWSGHNTLYCRDVIRTLSLAQYSCVIVPLDALQNRCVTQGILRLGKVALDTLVVCDYDLLPEEARITLTRCGLRLITVSPSNLCELPRLLDNHAEHLSLSVPAPTLRYLRLREHDGNDLMFLVNESLKQTVDTRITNLEARRDWHYFDPIRQENYPFDGRLFLAPGESIFLSSKPVERLLERHLGTELLATFDTQDFKVSPSHDETFCGTLHYSLPLDALDCDVVIEIPGQRSDVVSCAVNGTSLGTLFAPPYRFFARRELLKTPAILRLDLTNTLGPRFRGGRFDQDVVPLPAGLKSKVVLRRG